MLWRDYANGIARFEDLLLAGDQETANRVRAKTVALKQKIEAETAAQVPAQTLALQRLVSAAPAIPASFDPRDAIRQLLAASDADRLKLWNRLRPSVDRSVWMRSLLDWCADDPQVRRADVARLLPLFADGVTVLPAEIHFLAMLARDLPTVARSSSQAGVVREALQIRILAERAAVGLGTQGEAIVPWIEPLIKQADIARRQAEDLLFASDEPSWSKASELLVAARAGYQQAEKTAESVRAALRTWQQSAQMLPDYARWLAERPRPDTWTKRREREVDARRVEELWLATGKLGSLVTSPPASDKPEFARHLEDLAQTSSQAQVLFQTLDRHGQQTITRLLSIRPECDGKTEPRADAVHWWHEAEAARLIPFGDDASRKQHRQLLIEERRVSRLLMVPPKSAPTTLPEVGEAETREQAFEMARRRGLSLLQRIGDEAWKLGESPKGESFEEVRFRLEHFIRQADARPSLAGVGNQLAATLFALPERINDGLRDRESIAAIIRKDQLTRRLPLVSSSIESAPAPLLRTRELAALLMGQTERTVADHWYGGELPYYRRAGNLLLADVRKRLGKEASPQVETLAGALAEDDPFPLKAVAPVRRVLTDELRAEITFNLDRATDSGQLGYAVFRVDNPYPGKDVEVKRQPRRIDAKTDLAPILESIIPPSDEALTIPIVESRLCRLHGYFRGRATTTDVKIERHPLADRIVNETPLPKASSIAVVTDPDIHQRFGVAKGSIAFVIDCSGSMGPEEPGGRDRYRESLDAMQTIMRRLPNGVNVTVWTFGRRTPEQSPAESTIETLGEPLAWDRNNPKQAEVLLQELRAKQPWYPSPIVRTLLRAREKLRAETGYKAIVLFSDCNDTRFAEDEEFKKKGRSIRETLRAEFDGNGIPLHVVAVEPLSKEETDEQTVFQIVKELRPPGLFVRPTEAE
ncbi:MAG: VWA domain-containing protein, partial [Planctomycetes bacterium]|nr:VWA domain-containing protein [Planctomycetota bacterium]